MLAYLPRLSGPKLRLPLQMLPWYYLFKCSGASYYEGSFSNISRNTAGDYVAVSSRGNFFMTWSPGELEGSGSPAFRHDMHQRAELQVQARMPSRLMAVAVPRAALCRTDVLAAAQPALHAAAAEHGLHARRQDLADHQGGRAAGIT